MKLEPQQEEKVRAWAAEGASLSDIQTRLADEFGIRISYLDTRFLLIDLKVDLAEKPEKKPAAAAAADPLAAAQDAGFGASGAPEGSAAPDPYDPTSGYPAGYDDPAGPEDMPAGPEETPDGAGAPGGDSGAGDSAAAPAAGQVQVELDRIQRPGFAASGSLTCSDGTKGDWGIDNYGRIALAFPGKKGYRPSPADQQAFMQRLQSLLGGY